MNSNPRWLTSLLRWLGIAILIGSVLLWRVWHPHLTETEALLQTWPVILIGLFCLAGGSLVVESEQKMNDHRPR